MENRDDLKRTRIISSTDNKIKKNRFKMLNFRIIFKYLNYAYSVEKVLHA